MYPVAKKLLENESNGDVITDSLWLTCSTTHNSATDPTLDFVLSVTPGPQGAYPVFICTSLPIDQLSADYILPRIQQMVEALYDSVPVERVYSIFAPAPITHAFAEAWTRRTGVELDADPEYYSAKLTHCTYDTFRNRRSTLPIDRSYILRPAVSSDIPAAAELCHGFAAVSVRLTFSVATRKRHSWRQSPPPIQTGTIHAFTRRGDSGSHLPRTKRHALGSRDYSARTAYRNRFYSSDH